MCLSTLTTTINCGVGTKIQPISLVSSPSSIGNSDFKIKYSNGSISPYIDVNNNEILLYN